MDSANVRENLKCSICRDLFRDPVSLQCGHSFCQVCIGSYWDNKKVYPCPECRAQYEEKPAISTNTVLSNIVNAVSCKEEETGITCTSCQVSWCDTHLSAHTKSPEHILTKPPTSLGDRKCSVHKNDLEYFCCEDKVCICVTCKERGHLGHTVTFKKMKDLRMIIDKLTTEKEKIGKKVRSLKKHIREVQEKATSEKHRVSLLMRDIREDLEDLEKQVRDYITGWEKQISLSLSDKVHQLESNMEDLSRKIHHTEDLCTMSDPLCVLQGRIPDRDEVCDTKGSNEDTEIDVTDLDEGLISLTLHTGITNIVSRIKGRLCVKEATGMLMDASTAGNYINLSGDFKTLSLSPVMLHRPTNTKRFKNYQVLSTRCYTSSKHYWIVETSEKCDYRVGVAYPSVDNDGRSHIGDNDKSWCLHRSYEGYIMKHDGNGKKLHFPPTCQKFGISLNCETGRVSFYELGDPIIHLHTFTATFTEPLHAAFCVSLDGWVRIIS
ncbi:E3 ubiquitin/ISG15 ligase TRIM25-like [Rhinophrynus dorsalis]